jgi:hypothetical protein
MNWLKHGVLFAISGLFLLVSSVSAKALMIAPPPLAQRVALADSIVIGKVVGLEEKKVKVEGGEYTIATIKVESAYGKVTNVKKLDTVRVGYLVPTVTPTPGPGRPGLIRPGGIRRMPTAQLFKDQVVCVFLNPHAKGDFYIMPAYYDVILKSEDNEDSFKQDIAEVKKLAKLLENTKAGLESKEENDRFLTAAMLIHRLRDRRNITGEVVEEPIDAAQSKLILNALAKADWTGTQVQTGPRRLHVAPLNLFFNLNITPEEGWKQPENGQNLAEEAQAWVKKNADTYRIKRVVEKKKADKE